MLSQLSIRNILLIDTLDLIFDPTLTVLTGETGAGKSIILDALSLVLGARGDGNLVRSQASRGSVTATFDLSPAITSQLQSLLESLGIEDALGTCPLVLRRLQEADGRTRAFINEIPVSVQALKTISAYLIEIHGQWDGWALSDTATHRTWLDAYGGLKNLAHDTMQAYEALQKAQEAYENFQARHAEFQKERDFLAHAVDELTQLAPQVGEEETLAEQRRTLVSAEKITQALSHALSLLNGQSPLCTTLASATRFLERQSPTAPDLMAPCVTALDNALSSCEEALDRLHKALQTSEPSPHVLEQVEERLFALRGAARKYGVDPDRLADLCERYTADLSACDHEDEILAQLTAAVSDARQIYGKKAHALSEARHTWSRRLEEAVMEELPALKLAQARFFLQLETDRSLESAAGYDQVEFWVQTNAGSRPGPLMKVASGGELSRLLLAIKVVISQKWSVPTLIFDEIDTGMGGAAADAVGVRLERLAHHVQVIAITHAPQVAARAKDHYVVAKSPQDGCTHVLSLCPDGRREEIARMLSGARVSDEARAAASQLLEREAS